MKLSSPALFADRPASADAFRALEPVLEGLGPITVEEKKTCLHIVAGKSAFLGVHPRKDGLRLNIALARPLEGDRIVKCERASANRYHNELNVWGSDDIDDELAAWLLEAYNRVAT